MWGKTGINEAVLAELRAIRSELHEVTVGLGLAATRKELEDALKAHEAQHQERVEGWRWWGPFVISGLVAVLYLLQVAGVHLALKGTP